MDSNFTSLLPRFPTACRFLTSPRVYQNKMLHYQNYRLNLTSLFFQRHFFKQLWQRYGSCKKKNTITQTSEFFKKSSGNVLFVSNPNLLELLVVTTTLNFQGSVCQHPRAGLCRAKKNWKCWGLGRGCWAVWKFIIPLAFENYRKFVAIFLGIGQLWGWNSWGVSSWDVFTGMRVAASSLCWL